MKQLFLSAIALCFVPLFSISPTNTESKNNSILSGLSFSIGYANSWVSHNNPKLDGSHDVAPYSFKSTGGHSIGVAIVNNPFLSNERFCLEPNFRYIVRGYQQYHRGRGDATHQKETKLSYLEPYLKVKLNTARGIDINPFIGIGISLLTKAETSDLRQPPITTTMNYANHDIFLMAGFDLTFLEKYFIGFEYSKGTSNILHSIGQPDRYGPQHLWQEDTRLYNNTINVSLGILF